METSAAFWSETPPLSTIAVCPSSPSWTIGFLRILTHNRQAPPRLREWIRPPILAGKTTNVSGLKAWVAVAEHLLPISRLGESGGG